nr:DNA polymerase III subunit delta [Chloroflexota bacterium]
MLYLFHGEDEFTRSEALAKAKKSLGDPIVAGLNTTVFDGRKINLVTLIQACDALPFMSERRLVIVEEFWSKFEPPKEGKLRDKQPKISEADEAFFEGLKQYLPRLPETTYLAFVESRSLSPTNPVFRTLPLDKKWVYVKEFTPPAERDLGRWIEQRMKAKGGKITPQAAHALACLVGSELRVLDQELEKLLAYANFQRTVTLNDVHELVNEARTYNVFALVNAIGLRQRENAVRYLHKLLESGAAPAYLLTMIERQFRILLQVTELQSQGVKRAQIQKTLEIRHAFIVDKASEQAEKFSIERLESIYRRLAEVEQAIKTGQMDELLALDLLVVELCAG